MPIALFVSYGGGHVNMVIPVVRELQRRKGWKCVVLGLTMAKPALDMAGIPALGFRDLVVEQDAEALVRGRELLTAHHVEGVGIAAEESIAYLGLSYADLEKRLGTEEAARRFAQKGRMAFLPLGPLERLIDRVHPDVVIATNSPRAEEAAIRTARTRGVRSLCMVDLFGLDFGATHLAEPNYADRLTVLSEYVRDLLVDQGRPGEHIVVTGNPAFDELGNRELPRLAAALRQKCGWDGKKIILWASQRQPDEQLPIRLLKMLLDILERHSDWYLVYRPHPNETPLCLPSSPRVRVSDRAEQLSSLLSAVDTVVVMTTTVGMQAALLGKGLVKVCLSPFNPYAPYEHMGLALPVHRLEELEGQLEAAVSDGPAAQGMAAARKRLPPPGGAASRVANVIEDLVS